MKSIRVGSEWSIELLETAGRALDAVTALQLNLKFGKCECLYVARAAKVLFGTALYTSLCDKESSVGTHILHNRLECKYFLLRHSGFPVLALNDSLEDETGTACSKQVRRFCTELGVNINYDVANPRATDAMVQ